MEPGTDFFIVKRAWDSSREPPIIAIISILVIILIIAIMAIMAITAIIAIIASIAIAIFAIIAIIATGLQAASPGPQPRAPRNTGTRQSSIEVPLKNSRKESETEPNRPNRIEPNRLILEPDAEPNRTEPRRVQKTQAEPRRTGKMFCPNRTEPNRTEPNRTEPNRTEPMNFEKSGTETNRTEPVLPGIGSVISGPH